MYLIYRDDHLMSALSPGAGRLCDSAVNWAQSDVLDGSMADDALPLDRRAVVEASRAPTFGDACDLLRKHGLTIDRVPDVADVQVRISATGHPFQPGHGVGVGGHGEIGGKITPEALAAHKASVAAERRKSAAFLAAHGKHSPPGAKEAHQAAQLAETARKNAVEAKAQAAHSKAQIAKAKAAHDARAAEHRTAKSSLASAKKAESAAARAAKKRGATPEHAEAHRLAKEALLSAQVTHDAAEARASAAKAAHEAAKKQAAADAAAARKAHADHTSLNKAAAVAAKKATETLKARKARWNAEAEDHLEIPKFRETVAGYERQMADISQKLDKARKWLHAEETAPHPDESVVRKAKNQVELFESTHTWLTSELRWSKGKLNAREKGAKDYVKFALAGEKIAQKAAQHPDRIAPTAYGADIHVHPNTHPAAIGAAVDNLRQVVRNLETRGALRENNTTLFVVPHGTHFTDHEPFSSLKGRTYAGHGYESADGVANVIHKGRVYLSMPENGTVWGGDTSIHEIAHAVHFARMSRRLTR